jgi:hypothetical protein
MAPETTPPLPGSMTVPPLFGWQNILTVLTVLLVVAVVFFLASATGRSVDGRSEWQAALAARSRGRRPPEDGPAEGLPAEAGTVRPDRPGDASHDAAEPGRASHRS